MNCPKELQAVQWQAPAAFPSHDWTKSWALKSYATRETTLCFGEIGHIWKRISQIREWDMICTTYRFQIVMECHGKKCSPVLLLPTLVPFQLQIPWGNPTHHRSQVRSADTPNLRFRWHHLAESSPSAELPKYSIYLYFKKKCIYIYIDHISYMIHFQDNPMQTTSNPTQLVHLDQLDSDMLPKRREGAFSAWKAFGLSRRKELPWATK